MYNAVSNTNRTSILSKIIAIWIIAVTVVLYILIQKQGLIGKDIYRIGPNPELYILGFSIDTYQKYIIIASFCFINSGMRTINNEMLRPWITNQIQDVSKQIEVSKSLSYEISCICCIYTWFDFFMYMNIVLSQIDMMLIEVSTDLSMTIILTSYYIK
jgi:hypothetical protein